MKKEIEYLRCQRGYIVDSTLSAKHCYKCKFMPMLDDSPVASEDETVCIAAHAVGEAMSMFKTEKNKRRRR